MSYGTEDLELEDSTNKRMAWGAVLLFLFVLAFPVYWLTQPSRLEASQKSFDESLAMLGEELYNDSCVQCHGGDATGGIGPALNSEQFLTAAADDQIVTLISVGVPGTAMSAFGQDFAGPLTSEQVEAVTTYVRQWEEEAPDVPDWREPGV